mmetsp:Transcript_5290/g.8038  ORF Transcript_5290/g.8038 Transcript_5290/m.8038 type:complete len:290 (+) Transcript_5290:132-1001(+)
MFVNHNSSTFGAAPRRSAGLGGNPAPIAFNENSNVMSTKKTKNKKGLGGNENVTFSNRSFGKQLDGNATTTPARTTTTKRRALGDISNRKNGGGGGGVTNKQQPLLQKSVSFQSSSKSSHKKASGGLMKRSSTALTPSRKANFSIPQRTQSTKKASTKTVIFADNDVHTDDGDAVEDIELPAGRLWCDEPDSSYDDDDEPSLDGLKTWREDQQKVYDYQLEQKRKEIQQKEYQADLALTVRIEKMFQSDIEDTIDCLDDLIMDDGSNLLAMDAGVLGANDNDWRCDISF